MPDGGAQGDTVPDVYVDQLAMAQSPWGLTLTFSQSASTPHPTRPAEGTPQVIVRMSLEHAKAMIMIMRKSLKQYELESLGDPIKIPRAQLAKMDLTEDDW
jgi:hypothetical protein